MPESASTPTQAAPAITVAVVNWTGRRFLPACLGSLRAQTGISLEILFIDNASSDDSVAFVRREFSEVRIIENATNMGYGPALNQAIDSMRGDALLALNTDIRLEPDCIATLAACLARRRAERCGSVQGKVLQMNARGERTGRIYSAGHVMPRSRLVYNRGSGQADRGQFDSEEPIPGANGACALMSREMLEDLKDEAGVFDPLFFLYGNDADLDWRAAMAGWRCWYAPEAVSHHLGEGSSGVTGRGFDAPFINVRYLMMIKNDRFGDVLRDMLYIKLAHIFDVMPKIARKPSLLFSIPADFVKCLPEALRARRRNKSLRRAAGSRSRDWIKWSTDLLRASRSKD